MKLSFVDLSLHPGVLGGKDGSSAHNMYQGGPDSSSLVFHLTQSTPHTRRTPLVFIVFHCVVRDSHLGMGPGLVPHGIYENGTMYSGMVGEGAAFFDCRRASRRGLLG